MADCSIIRESSYHLNFNQILKDKAENLSLWNKPVSFEETRENNWNNAFTVAKGMLHQYTSQQYSNLNSHYSPLNSCSHLLEETYLQPSKISEVNKCAAEENNYFRDEKEHNESEKQSLSRSQSQAQPEPFDAKEMPANCETKKLVHTGELFEQTVTNKGYDTETSQLIINDEQSKNAQKSEFKNDSYGYQKYESQKEENDILPFIDLDMETIIGASVNENEEYKQKIQTTANEINKICDENESGFRLPGFHQAFGSTEIGRFVHQKDFLEQIALQPNPSIHQTKTTAGILCGSSNSATGSSGGVESVNLNSLTNLGSFANLSNSRVKPRCNKRIKAPPPLEGADRNTCWNYEATDCDRSICTSATNNVYCNRKDLRRTKGGQNPGSGSALGYYNSDEYYANCSSPSSSSSSSYYGGCSDYMNCEYYRYQQNSQYQNYIPSSYSSVHSSYNNNNNNNNNFNYTDEHSQRLSYTSSSMSYNNNQNWRGERFFPYGEQYPYRYRQTNSSSYMYQHFVSQSQHLSSQQSYNNYGYNSYPPVPHYNYF